MSRERVTLKDLAERLGVSVSTVSRALGGHERISGATRARIEAAAREIGYTPNRAARTLVSGRTGFAAFVVRTGPDAPDPGFTGALLSGLAAGLAPRGIDLLVTAADGAEAELALIRHIARARRADGLILTDLLERDARAASLMAAEFPFVSLGSPAESQAGGARWTVETDGFAAFRQAFDMLHALGHRRFGLVSLDAELALQRRRIQGLLDGIRRHGGADRGVSLRAAHVPAGDAEELRHAIRRLLDGENRPTAVFGTSDDLALSVLAEAGELGLAVPRDLSVIGHDDTPGARLAQPGLTTFDAALPRCAEALAELFALRLDDRAPPQGPSRLPPRFLSRGSHGPAPGFGGTAGDGTAPLCCGEPAD